MTHGSLHLGTKQSKEENKGKNVLGLKCSLQLSLDTTEQEWTKKKKKKQQGIP